MARAILLLALCVLPALVAAARPARNPFEVEGRVYCDTCRAGFETSKTTYVAGAKVRVECKDRKTMELVYSKEGTTDSTGTYRIHVDEDHQDQLCDAMLVSSPQHDCMKPSSGRDRARVILTNNNGIVSNKRYANSIGFMKEDAMSGCFELLRQYQEYED
ncbi:pollen-specific protein C13 [Ricinus communis]|uniref:Pollen-specific protein C13, putative n=1 Tax=Ricinus communis TaxID=3988 RepID=B9RJG6_RICCO|nr:pollen-specific protein C13 [Ricinus communis]EEF48468.1 Pollen-specific protein C13 precursor, putative [Ricinus communis]|eukprot:XP_002513885.1 pollen-specific protein C13 [Ricinus communis]